MDLRFKILRLIRITEGIIDVQFTSVGDLQNYKWRYPINDVAAFPMHQKIENWGKNNDKMNCNRGTVFELTFLKKKKKKKTTTKKKQQQTLWCLYVGLGLGWRS